MYEKEFLESYEIKTWVYSPGMYKMLGVATVLNLVALVVIGQTNLLQSKACDSPYVGKVCQVLDTIYVGAKVFSGDLGYVVEEYNRTEIDDAEVVWVSEDGLEPQLQYPQGYFYNEQDEQDSLDTEFAINESPVLPPVNNSPIITRPRRRSGSLFNKPQRLPKKRKTLDGDLPDSIISRDTADGTNDSNKKSTDKLSDTELAKNANNKKPDSNTDNGNKTKDPKKDPLENATAKKSDPVKGLEINKKPLQDFADFGYEKWVNKTVDFGATFDVRLTAELTKNGRLDPEKTRYTKAVGNPEMVEIAKRAIESVGDSGWLDYLSRFDVKKATMVFAQNDSQLLAVVDSALPTPEKANTVASGLRGIIQAALLAHNNGWKKLKDDEVALLKAANISSKGKVLRINFNLEKPIAQEMIDKQFKEYQAKKLKEKDKTSPEAKPSGTVDKQESNSNSAK